jgi:hypothetical protein
VDEKEEVTRSRKSSADCTSIINIIVIIELEANNKETQ